MQFNIDTLELILKNQQWVGGKDPSVNDKLAYESLKQTHPNTLAWFALVNSYSEEVRQSWNGEGK